MSLFARALVTLILTLALAGGGVLPAGPSGDGAVAMVICGADGPETVWVDARGDVIPPGPAHGDVPCADDCGLCVLCGGCLLPGAAIGPVPALRAGRVAPVALPAPLPLCPVILVLARGPPLPKVSA